MRSCAEIKRVLPLLSTDQFKATIDQLLAIAKDQPIPGIYQLIGYCHFLMQNEDAAAKSLMLSHTITIFHKGRGLKALEEARSRFCT